MAGGDHGHGEGHETFKAPDWRQYKIDGIKELELTQRRLAEKGLKDPWIRNEVWRYHKDNYKGLFRNMYHTFSTGFKWAVLGMVITIAVDKYFGISASKKKASHGHH